MRSAVAVCLLFAAGSIAMLPAGEPDLDLAELLQMKLPDPPPGFAPASVTPVVVAPPVASSRRLNHGIAMDAVKLPETGGPPASISSPPVVSDLMMNPVAADVSLRKLASVESLDAELRLLPDQTGGYQFATSNNASSEIRFDSDLPQLRVSTVGPDTLVVGKSARYTITLTNNSNFEADNVDVRCAIPEWVQLESHRITTGLVEPVDSLFVWKVDSIPARGAQNLQLNLTPSAGKAFDLNVDIAVQPTKARKQIKIKEPKLSVKLLGPTDIVYGATSVWQVEIHNPGTGDANDVRLGVFTGERQLGSESVGTVPAGATRLADLEVAAREVGVHSLRATVDASLGLADQAEADFFVRRGQLVVDVTGSEMEYAGGSTTYNVTLRNIGDAEVRKVLVDMSIPYEMKYEHGLSQVNVAAGGISWVVDRLAVGQEVEFPVRVAINDGGHHRVQVTATTVDELTASDEVVTESLTSADLKLEVIDPIGPRALGALDEYVIHVTNHGTDTARKISVIAVCAPEVEPLDVSGNAAIRSGQVFFKPIEELEPDHRVTYKVMVRASKPGTHAFRVIVKCYDPSLRLASEESTRYFQRGGGRIGREMLSLSPPNREPEIVTQRDEASSR